MDPIDIRDDAELERLLGSVADSRPDTQFRDRLLDQTTRVIRGRSRRRRIGFLFGMAACYVAGLATMRLLTDSQPVGATSNLAQVPPVAIAPSDDNSPVAVAVDPDEPSRPTELPAAVLERLAELAPDESFRDFYRQAGDRYMKETGDLAAALRCYRTALKFAPPQSLVIGEEDNWLLASLKQSRLEEYRHAINGG